MKIKQTKQDTDNENELGKLIDYRMKILWLNQSELSRLASVGESYLSRIRHGKRKPSAHLLKSLAKPLGITHHDLMVAAGQIPTKQQLLDELEILLNRVNNDGKRIREIVKILFTTD